LFEKGYNFVVPDLQGYGYNEGLKGDFEWNAHVQNLIDTVDYAKKYFKKYRICYFFGIHNVLNLNYEFWSKCGIISKTQKH